MSKKEFIRHQFNPPGRVTQEPHEYDVNGKILDPGLTKQEMADDCDINRIMSKYEKTGILPDMIKNNPSYGDFTAADTYHESLNLVLFAEEQFNALPAKIRHRFDNEPGKFLEFCNNPANASEMIELGLATARPQEIDPRGTVAPKKAPPEAKADEGNKP